MTVRSEIQSGQLAELLKEVQAGNEVLLTQNQEPVAKLVATSSKAAAPTPALQIRSFTGHRALNPVISQSELADEMFERR